MPSRCPGYGGPVIVLLLAACTAGAVPPPVDTTDPCPTGQAADATGACVPEACLPIPEGDVVVAVGGTGDGSVSTPMGDLQAAVDRGGTVVVGPGTWTGLLLDDHHDGLVILGRCPELVVVAGDPGLSLDGAEDTRVEVSGLTLTGRGGIAVQRGTLVAHDLVVDGAEGVGVAATGSGAALELTDVRVTGTEVLDRVGGNGGRFEDGADLVATRTSFEQNHDVGLILTGRGTAGTLTDVTVRDTAEARDGEDGWGLYVADGADVVATGLLLAGNRSVSLVAGQSGTSLTLSDAVIEGTLAGDNDAVGYGAQVGFGGIITLTRVDIRDSVGIGLVLSGSSTVTLEDVTIAGVSGPDHVSLDCLYAEDGVVVEASGLDLRACGTLGAGAEQPGTTLRFTDGGVYGPRVNAGDFGAGIYLEDGAVAELTRFVTETTGALAISVGASTATLVDVSVVDGRGIDGSFGWGVEVVDGGTVEADGLSLDGLREVGLIVGGVGSTATLRDLQITNTVRSVGSEGAVGLVTQDGGALSVSGFTSTANQGPALLVLDGAIVASGGTIEGSQFAGVVLIGGSLDLSDTTIADGVADPALGGGVGVFISAQEVYSYGAPEVRLRDVTIGPHPLVGVWIEDGVGGTLDLQDVDLTGGEGVELAGGVQVHGNALYAWGTVPWDGTRGLRVAGALVHDAPSSAVLLDQGTATIEAVWTGNESDVRQQRCGDAPAGTYTGAERVEICPERDVVVVDLAYATYPNDVEAER